MITLALFRYIAEQGVAGLEADVNFFYDELPMQLNGKPASGTWLVTRGSLAGDSGRPRNIRSIADFYVALPNKAEAAKIHSEILAWVRSTKTICSLSGEVGGVAYSFANIRIWPTTTPENVGITENGNLVKMASVQIIYDIND